MVVKVSIRALSLTALLGACQGAPDGSQPAAPPAAAAAGSGLVAVDDGPPAGAVSWARPTWRVGDRFTLVRGEQLRGTFEVVGADDGVYTIDVGNGRQLRRDFDLGNLGEWQEGSAEPLRVMLPADVRYHWPLWLGKRWRCEFVDRVQGGEALLMSADYVVEGMDEIGVPAGVFSALRIVRTLRLAAAEGRFLTRTQVVWYAPEPGIEVRQLLGDTMVELVEFVRG